MIQLLRVPQLSTGSDTTTLVEWTAPAGAAFSAGATLGLLETDKALVELPAEQDGVLLLTLVEAGSTVGVDDPVAILGTAADLGRSAEALMAEAGLTGTGPAEVEPANAATDVAPPPPPPTIAHERIFASPLARRLAKEAGLEITDLIGTGLGGRIVRRDVEAASQARKPVQAPVSAPARVAPSSKIRRVMAAHLSTSKATIPHFYLRGRARAEALLAARDELNANRDAGDKITINDLIVKAVGRAHASIPAMNTIWADDAIVELAAVDVSVAVATDDGLITPVVRSVDASRIENIAATTRRLTAEARAGRIRQSDIDGAAITVSNLGMYAVDEFTAIINPPQSAILAVGAVRDEPVVSDSAVVPGKVMRFMLSVDHRPIDGAVAARWMHEFVSLIESPIRIVA